MSVIGLLLTMYGKAIYIQQEDRVCSTFSLLQHNHKSVNHQGFDFPFQHIAEVVKTYGYRTIIIRVMERKSLSLN